MNNIISFVMVGTNDLEKSRKFYEPIMKLLGLKQVSVTDRYIGYGHQREAGYAALRGATGGVMAIEAVAPLALPLRMIALSAVSAGLLECRLVSDTCLRHGRSAVG